MTPVRRGLVAELIVRRSNHLAFTSADRQVFVKRVQNGCIRQCVDHLTNQVVAQEKRVLEMDHIRADRLEKVTKVFGVKIFAGHGAVQVVEAVPIGVDEILIGSSADRCHTGSLMDSPDRSNWWPPL